MTDLTKLQSGERRRPGSILIVDDYDDARACLRDVLEEAGHTVIEASNGQQALNLLVTAGQRVGVIVLDLQMPVMDGWRLIEILNGYVNLARIPVIIVTAASQPHLERIKHKAVQGCLQAPYETSALLELVEQCLGEAAPQSSAGTG